MSDQIIFYFFLSQPVSSEYPFHIRSSDRIHRMQMNFIIQSLFRQPVKQLYPITAIFRIIPQIMVAVDQFDLTLCTFYESDCLIPHCGTRHIPPVPDADRPTRFSYGFTLPPSANFYKNWKSSPKDPKTTPGTSAILYFYTHPDITISYFLHPSISLSSLSILFPLLLKFSSFPQIHHIFYEIPQLSCEPDFHKDFSVNSEPHQLL